MKGCISAIILAVNISSEADKSYHTIEPFVVGHNVQGRISLWKK